MASWCEDEYFKGAFILLLIAVEVMRLFKAIFGREAAPPAIQYRVISRRIVAFELPAPTRLGKAVP